MATYLELNNDITTVIDDSFFNLAFIRKERRKFTPTGGGDTWYRYYYEVDVTGIPEPVVAFSCICAASYYRLSVTKIVVVVSAANQQNVPSAVSKLNNASNFIDIYIFGRPVDNTPNIGFKAWDASGRLVFDANHRYMQPVQMIQEDANYNPVAGGNNPFRNNKTVSLPTGRIYAVYPLNRIFNIQAEWLSNGWESWYQADIYSSQAAVDGGIVYLTSGVVDSVEDTSVVSIGVCRHHYMVLDVTNY